MTLAPPSPLRFPHGTEVLAAGIGFTEGPVAVGPERALVASVSRGQIYQLDLGGGDPEPWFECGAGPNGLALGDGGEVWVAQNGATAMPSRSTLDVPPSVQRVTTGTRIGFADPSLTSPSDCVFGPDGRLWFTDPADHRIDGPSEPGALRVFDPAQEQFTTVASGLSFPNGLAFGEDPTELYVAETALGTVSRYRVAGDSVTADGWRVELPAGRPDGIALDSEGWLWVAGSVGDNVLAFDQQGRLRESLSFGTGVLVTSLCFAGPRLETLLVTVAKGGHVLALPALHPGLPLPVWR